MILVKTMNSMLQKYNVIENFDMEFEYVEKDSSGLSSRNNFWRGSGHNVPSFFSLSLDWYDRFSISCLFRFWEWFNHHDGSCMSIFSPWFLLPERRHQQFLTVPCHISFI